MKKQKEEAERYAGLQEKRKELQQRLYLIKLYQVEHVTGARDLRPWPEHVTSPSPSSSATRPRRRWLRPHPSTPP